MSRVINLCIIGMGFVMIAPLSARGQCPNDWRPGLGFPGPNFSVRALATWDPDGSGLEPARLVVAGGFYAIEGQLIRGVAQWDGVGWQPLGAGIPATANSIVVYDGELYAGGNFSDPNLGAGFVSDVARWNGETWESVSLGLGAWITGGVFALVVYDGELIAGGDLSLVDGQTASNIVRWSSTSGWRPLGTGVNVKVRALSVYDGELIVGGDFTSAGGAAANRIARWSESAGWRAMDSGLDGNVFALEVHNGDLIVGGAFTNAGEVVANRIARWDGDAWSALGSGMDRNVTALTHFNGELIAGGEFRLAGGQSTQGLSMWDGAQWQRIGTDDGTSSSKHFLTLLEFEGKLYAGGGPFPVPGTGIANWDGTEWHAMGHGVDQLVQTMVVFDGELYVSGFFSTFVDPLAYCYARWDGSTWRALAQQRTSDAKALFVWRNALIAGGSMRINGGPTIATVVLWNGTEWLPLGEAMGGTVYALGEYDGELIAGGQFNVAGGIQANCIARWNGSQWRPLGEGLNGTVYAICNFQGDLVAAGHFTMSDGLSAMRIARWDGTSWLPFGDGLGATSTDFVQSLAVYHGDLIAGGRFQTAGGVDVRQVARWDGESWHPLGEGLTGQDTPGFPSSVNVDAVVVYQDQLFACGTAAYSGGNHVGTVARWDGVSWWSAVDDLPGGTVKSLAVYNDELMVGGDFRQIGPDRFSCYWGRLGPTCLSGDMNCDGAVDDLDFPLFVSALLDHPEAGTCESYSANIVRDVEFDGTAALNGLDVQAFVALLLAD